MKQYAITGSYYRTLGNAKPSVVQVGGLLTKKQQKSKVNPEGFQISEICNISTTDPSKYDVVKEVTEFSYKPVYEDGSLIDFAKAEPGEKDAINVKAPFTRNESVIFTLVYGAMGSGGKQLYNAVIVNRSNFGGKAVPYLKAIGKPIEQSLVSPHLRIKITDSSGSVLPKYAKLVNTKSQSKESVKKNHTRLVNSLME